MTGEAQRSAVRLGSLSLGVFFGTNYGRWTGDRGLHVRRHTSGWKLEAGSWS